MTEARKWYLTGAGKTGRWADTGGFAPISERDPAGEIPNPKPKPKRLPPPPPLPGAVAAAHTKHKTVAPPLPPEPERQKPAETGEPAVKQRGPVELPPPEPREKKPEPTAEDTAPAANKPGPAASVAEPLGMLMGAGLGALVSRVAAGSDRDPLPVQPAEQKALGDAAAAVLQRYLPAMETRHPELLNLVLVTGSVYLAHAGAHARLEEERRNGPPDTTEPSAPEPAAAAPDIAEAPARPAAASKLGGGLSRERRWAA